MFWEVWRNVTSANWGLGAKNANSKGRSSSKSTRKAHRYNRLVSSSSSISNSSCSGTAAPAPKKSVSQPVNLSKFIGDNTGHNDSDLIPSVKNVSQIPPIGGDISTPKTGKEFRIASSTSSSASVSGKAGGDCVKHSFSSFFPSCTFYGTMVKSKSTDYNHRLGSSDENGDEDVGKGKATATGTCFPLTSDIPADFDSKNCQERVKVVAEDTTAAGHMEEGDDELELPTCDVCARAFPTIRQLAAHQRKKRHYGCIQCDSIFPSREVLECHREQMCHYEFAIDMYDANEEDLNDEQDFFESDDEEGNGKGLRDEEDWQDEDMERLL